MVDEMVPLKLPPGFFRNGTALQGASRWVNGSLVRFLDGTIRPLGGWRAAQGPSGNTLPALTGVPRKVHGWRDAAGNYRVAIGTTEGLYMLNSGVVTSITPAGFMPASSVSVPHGVHSAYYPGGGLFGAGPLGSTLVDGAMWSLDTFGNYVVGVCTTTGRLYVQTDAALPPSIPMGAPMSSIRAVVATDERFLVVLGGPANVRLVSWASQETIDDWVPSEFNTAGDFEIASNGALQCGVSVPGATFLFTDVDVWAMTYIGSTLVFRFDRKGDNCGVISPNAVAKVDTQIYWMGQESFFAFDGFAKKLPCEVADYVFNDFNLAQRVKVWAVSNTLNGEVTWFYPSSGALECDRYVTFNYVEGHWTTGNLVRTAGIDAGVTPFPVWLGADGTLYEHEYGHDHGGAVPFIESGSFSLGKGDQVMRVQSIVPDEKTLGDVHATFYTALWPMGDEQVHGPYNASVKTNVRMTGRLVRVRLEEARPIDWRVGVMQLGLRTGGRR